MPNIKCSLVSDFEKLANDIREKYFRIVNLDTNYQCFLIVSVEFGVDQSIKLNYQTVSSFYNEIPLSDLNSDQLSNYSKYLKSIERFCASGELDFETDIRSEKQFKRWLKLNKIVDYPQLVDAGGNLL